MNETEQAADDPDAEQPAGVDDDRSDSRTDPDRRQSPVVEADAIDERVAGQPQAVDVAPVAEVAAVLEDLTVHAADEHSTAEPVSEVAPAPAAGSAEAGPVETVVAATTPAGDIAVNLPADGEAFGSQTGTVIDEGGADGIDSDGTAFAVGAQTRSATTERINGAASRIGATAEQVGPGDEVDENGAAAAGVPGDGGAAAGATVAEAMAGGAAMADRRSSSASDVDPTDRSADSHSSSEEPDAAGVAPLGQRPTAEDLESEPDPATGNPSPSPDAVDLVDWAEAEPGAGSDEAVDQPARTGDVRPALGLSPAATSRAPLSTPTQSAATTVDTTNPAAELVELQTTGLAERLRPALAAVRRSVNGLDELRLRIQDDNAGPIKVDIATIDNRVRVLLSAGNDDLMRQLGQERDRLADELRRAGFDQASIDIESDDSGRRHDPYKRGASDRSGSGAAGPGQSGPDVMSSIERTSVQRRRGLTGLDLDL